MSDYVFFCYWNNIEPNMLETCLASLRKVSPTTSILVAFDDATNPEYRDRLSSTYGAEWLHVPIEQVRRRRATSKIEVLESYVHQIDSSDQMIVSDVDVIFLNDPFRPFQDHPTMDLGVTTRGYPHLFPINAGVFYLRITGRIKSWLKWHMGEIYNPSWSHYVDLRREYHHDQRPYPLDWTVGQDFLIANWLHRQEVETSFGIEIRDVGPRYNYCPPTDTMGSEAFTLAWKALWQETPDIVVLHLKSELKRMIYDECFPNAKIHNPKGRLAWM